VISYVQFISVSILKRLVPCLLLIQSTPRKFHAPVKFAREVPTAGGMHRYEGGPRNWRSFRVKSSGCSRCRKCPALANTTTSYGAVNASLVRS
jgi:hypothetical protein